MGGEIEASPPLLKRNRNVGDDVGAVVGESEPMSLSDEGGGWSN